MWLEITKLTFATTAKGWGQIILNAQGDHCGKISSLSDDPIKVWLAFKLKFVLQCLRVLLAL